MEITFEARKEVSAKELEPGDVFIVSGNVYMKLRKHKNPMWPAIRLDTAEVSWFTDDGVVELANAELIIR